MDAGAEILLEFNVNYSPTVGMDGVDGAVNGDSDRGVGDSDGGEGAPAAHGVDGGVALFEGVKEFFKKVGLVEGPADDADPALGAVANTGHNHGFELFFAGVPFAPGVDAVP